MAKALVIAGYGLNCEEETSFAFEYCGFDSSIRHINDLIENPHQLLDYQVLCVPGGFSYGDDTGSGNAFAQKMRLTLWDHLKEFVLRDTLTLGICNGCQIVTNLGLAPALDNNYGERFVAVTHNLTARYQCRWVDVVIQDTATPWLQNVTSMHIPVAHGEGRFVMDKKTLKNLQDFKLIALRYAKENGDLAQEEFPYNPNGSMDDIAGLTDPSGKVLIMMPHPERGMFTWQRDDYAHIKDKALRKGEAVSKESDGMAIFQNAGIFFEVSKKKCA